MVQNISHLLAGHNGFSISMVPKYSIISGWPAFLVVGSFPGVSIPSGCVSGGLGRKKEHTLQKRQTPDFVSHSFCYPVVPCCEYGKKNNVLLYRYILPLILI